MRKRYRVNDLEKVFQLSGLVKRQSERKARIAKDFQDYRAKSVSRQDTRLFKRLKKSEKLRRVEEFKEDLRLGPLAPRRDVGPDREFAAINQTLFSPNDVDEATRISRWPFEPGDRVVILQGPDKGKIGILDSCDISNQSVKVRDMNLAKVRMPAYLKEKHNRASEVGITMERPLKMENVRMVYAFPHPQTGQLQDRIIEKVGFYKYRDDETGEVQWARHVAGAPDMLIPWMSSKITPDEHEDDTPRLVAEERTWMPTLQKPPMPFSVIDELRHKYSKYRTRHDLDWLQDRLDAGQEVEQRKQGAVDVQWPLRMGSEPKTKEKHRLSSVMYQRIGEVMAQTLTLEEVVERINKFRKWSKPRKEFLNNPLPVLTVRDLLARPQTMLPPAVTPDQRTA